jgi:hypothetical protein
MCDVYIHMCIAHLHDVGEGGVSGLVEAQIGSQHSGELESQLLGARIGFSVNGHVLRQTQIFETDGLEHQRTELEKYT